MIGKWLGALLSTPTHQIRLSGGTDAGVDFVPDSKGPSSWSRADKAPRP
jgi:hypothetical protein